MESNGLTAPNAWVLRLTVCRVALGAEPCVVPSSR